ncbi:MAG: glycosyltransferase family 2 protein [Patescibacteria group bacterium]|nr:glycosyltransferase family 2 protein [Patescibacteria group bacterium]
MDISIVIPNYNGGHLLETNIPKVLDAVAGYKKGSIEIIIPDDASTDYSLHVIHELIHKNKHKHSTIRYVENKKNKGFSGNVNSGVKLATGDILILLNTDVIPHKGFLEPLLEHFIDEKVFGVGCVDESIEGNAVVLRGRGVGAWKRGFLVHRAGSVEKTNTLWVSGGSSAFRKSIWDRIGGLNELYNPYYWEDIDLSFRAQKAGYSVLLEPRSRVVHEHSKGTIQTSQKPFRIRKIAFRNQFFFVWLNITDIFLVLTHIFWVPAYIIKTLASGDLAFLCGFLEALSMLPRVLQKRRKTVKLFIKGDREVIANSHE